MSNATTATDLRNAALVMEHLGYGTEEFVNGKSARVCLDGALQLATTHKLSKIKNPLLDGGRGGLMWSAVQLIDQDNVSYFDSLLRRSAAEEALCNVLPDRCERGDFHEGCQANWRIDGFPYENGHGELDGECRIYHYNDFVCDGGEGAINLLRMAADTLDAAVVTPAVEVAV